MANPLPVYPFDSDRWIGTVLQVGPNSVRVNLPRAASSEGRWHHGHRLGGGQVGEFVVIECPEVALFGRLVEVSLPDRDRLGVEPTLGETQQVHPLGKVQLLTSITLATGVTVAGLSDYPRLGSRVYSCNPTIVKWLAEAFQRPPDGRQPVVIELAHLPSAKEVQVGITPERLFGRHCAVLGATGGGKSWTLARILQQAARYHAKVILFDATGEFHTLTGGVKHYYLGFDSAPLLGSTELVIPHTDLVEMDLFALFKPSGQTQAPKLRAAMKSLKLAKIVGPPLARNGHIVKSEQPKAPLESAYTQHSSTIETARTDFDITKLARQVENECVWPTAGTGAAPDPTRWWRTNEQERSYCVSLVSRIEDMIRSREMACMFQPAGKTTFSDALAAFLADEPAKIMRVSLKNLSFAHNAREIVANAMARYLLIMGRDGDFRRNPLLIVLDEAHQFLNQTLGDENARYPLDAFELIAK